jgi:hypothetical protein
MIRYRREAVAVALAQKIDLSLAMRREPELRAEKHQS